MSKFHSIVVLGVFLLLSPSVATAEETVVRTGQSVTVTSDQVVEGDLYAGASSVAISGSVQGDLYAAGGTVTLNGQVDYDATIFAGSAQVHAPVKDDLRIAGGEVVVAESVAGDLFVIAGSLKVLSSASIEGDIIFYGGQAEISAPVKGSVHGAADSFRIDSAVDGGVDVISAQPLVLGERANIKGDVRYKSAQDITRSQSAVVEGEVVKNNSTTPAEQPTSRATLISLMMSLFAALCLYLVAKEKLQQLSVVTWEHSTRSGLLGLGVLLGLPLAGVILVVTVLGLLPGVAGLFAYGVLMMLSYIVMPIMFGSLIAKLFSKNITVSLPWIIAGTAGIQLLLLIPNIGGLLVFVLFIITLGGLTYSAYKAFV